MLLIYTQKNVSKKSSNTFSIYIHLTSEIYEYLKTKIFSRGSSILSQIHWTSNIFGHSATIIGFFWVSLNYPILNFKKTVCPKRLDVALSMTFWKYALIWSEVIVASKCGPVIKTGPTKRVSLAPIQTVHKYRSKIKLWHTTMDLFGKDSLKLEKILWVIHYYIID